MKYPCLKMRKRRQIARKDRKCYDAITKDENITLSVIYITSMQCARRPADGFSFSSGRLFPWTISSVKQGSCSTSCRVYACPVWQSGLTAKQKKNQLETIQRRVMRTIAGSDNCELHCVVHSVEPVVLHLNNLFKSFFNHMRRPDEGLHHLFPPITPTEVSNRDI
jgi:hypothetical protein